MKLLPLLKELGYLDTDLKTKEIFDKELIEQFMKKGHIMKFH